MVSYCLLIAYYVLGSENRKMGKTQRPAMNRILALEPEGQDLVHFPILTSGDFSHLQKAGDNKLLRVQQTS